MGLWVLPSLGGTQCGTSEDCSEENKPFHECILDRIILEPKHLNTAQNQASLMVMKMKHRPDQQHGNFKNNCNHGNNYTPPLQSTIVLNQIPTNTNKNVEPRLPTFIFTDTRPLVFAEANMFLLREKFIHTLLNCGAEEHLTHRFPRFLQELFHLLTKSSLSDLRHC